ncbi:MAG: PspA/IM30 family protein [Thermomicrobiales bacterium]|nr:PspA/IM30 family protein [Thermomicrobiales bacterium]
MGIFDRMSQLIRANVNDILDRSEDPEKMLNQLIRDMEDSIRNARQQVAAMIVQEKELQADWNQTQLLANEWGQKAQRAVGAGKDDLAREALRRKRDNDENARVYGEQLAVQQQAVDKLKQQLRQLEAKYQSTLSQRDALVARQRRAEATRQVATAASATVFSPFDPTAELDRMERQIRSNEAHAAAALEMGEDTSLEAQFRELGADAEIESELAALKAGVGGAAPELTAGDGSSGNGGSSSA